MASDDNYTEASATKEFTITKNTTAEKEDTEVPTPAPTETPTPVPTKIPKKNSKKKTIGVSIIGKNGKFKLKWGAVPEADGFEIYASLCGKKLNNKTLNKTVTKKQTILKTISGSKILDTEVYKIQIKAFERVNGKKVYLGQSKVVHVAGEKHAKVTNAKSVNVDKTSLTLKPKETSKIKATITKENDKKLLLPESHGPSLRYHTSNNIATVTEKGLITAVKKGTCTIYVIALNGVKAKIKVTVK